MQKKFSLSSMTAFGSGEAVSAQGRFAVEIQSVNRRYLEVSINLPQHSAELEQIIRNRLGEKLSRGQIQLSLNWQGEKEVGLKPNLTLARELKEGWESIAEELGVDFTFDMRLLVGEKMLFTLQEAELPQKPILEALEAALASLIEMRQFEGAKIAEDFNQRLTFLEKALADLESGAQGCVERFREKLLMRLGELSQGTDGEERILREVALYADKVDVTEEIVRFRIHLQKFRQTMEEGGASGRKLDFLLQELMREANTLGAKGQMVVEIKSELERMREQVQNVE